LARRRQVGGGEREDRSERQAQSRGAGHAGHTWPRRSRRSARTTDAISSETMSPASRPSRRPISRFGTASLHTVSSSAPLPRDDRQT
jgi:hypothetical protein